MIQCSSVTTSAGGETAPGRGNRGDNASWADMNFTGPKNKKKFSGLIQLVQMYGEKI
jgi:hypothetical protein